MSFTSFRKKYSRSSFIVLMFAALLTFAAISLSAQALYVRKGIERSGLSVSDSAKLFDVLGVVQTNETKPFGLFADVADSGEIRQIQEKIKGGKNSSVFTDFEVWVGQYEKQSFRNSAQNNELGERLAIRRREALAKLIQQDPQAALEKSISQKTFENLPSFVSRHLEKHISVRGNLVIYSLDKSDRTSGQMTEASTEREVVAGESRYKAFVYGRRESMHTKFDIPLQGIVLDDLMAVDESPVRQIDSTEYSSRAIDEASLNAETKAVEVGGKTVYFSNQSDLDNFVDEQIKWESSVGPTRPVENSASNSLSAEQAAPAWTTGTKTVLFIRADFSDKPGVPLDRSNAPLTAARAQELMTNEVNPFYVNNSYGKTAIQVTVTQEIIRLPRTLSFYTTGDNYNEMYEDARIAARARGYESENFNLDIVGFTFTKSFEWDGNSIVGGKGNLLNGAFYLPEAAHELGHNYGLLHSNLWRTTDGTIAGEGFHIETGDCYDVMGLTFGCPAQGTHSHFNAHYKNRLGWIPDGSVQTVAETGTYRIYAQDVSSQGTRALKIRKDDSKNYWVEFRQLAGGNASNGALIRWDYESRSFLETELLDMTPQTPYTNEITKGDEALLIGQTFDGGNGIKITVLGKGGTTPESLDVRVEINKAVNCAFALDTTSFLATATGSIGGQTNIRAGSDCTWTATTNDSWITITSGSGVGNGVISFSVMRNDNGERTGTIIIAGIPFTVRQAAGSCGYSINPETFNVAASGGALNIVQGFSPGCTPLTPSSAGTSPWININTNPITVLPNSGSARTGTLKLVGEDINGALIQRTLLINQSGASSCSFSISPTTTNLAESGGLVSVTVSLTSGDGCEWTAVSNAAWITVTSGTSGNGSGTVSFSIASNSGAARTGSVTVAGQTFTLAQTAGVKSRKRTRFF